MKSLKREKDYFVSFGVSSSKEKTVAVIRNKSITSKQIEAISEGSEIPEDYYRFESTLENFDNFKKEITNKCIELNLFK